LDDGRWLRNYLGQRLDAARSATDPVDTFVPIAEFDQLMDAWVGRARKIKSETYAWPVDESDPLESTRAELLAAIREHDSLLKSTSWRITAPIRAIAPTLRAIFAIGMRLFSRFSISPSVPRGDHLT